MMRIGKEARLLYVYPFGVSKFMFQVQGLRNHPFKMSAFIRGEGKKWSSLLTGSGKKLLSGG